MRDALLDFIDSSEGLEVCGAAASAEEALPDLWQKGAQVAVLDLSLPGKSGLELLADIRSASSLPCLVLSGHDERSHVERALAAGANGYLRKGSPNDIVEAITVVAEGGAYLPEEERARARGRRGAEQRRRHRRTTP